ncbi:hypothetical protein D3C78_1181470 [compost metagenome]
MHQVVLRHGQNLVSWLDRRREVLTPHRGKTRALDTPPNRNCFPDNPRIVRKRPGGHHNLQVIIEHSTCNDAVWVLQPLLILDDRWHFRLSKGKFIEKLMRCSTLVHTCSLPG